MEMNFCRRCGKPLESADGHVFRCGTGHTLYLNSSPATAVFFIADDNQRVLLTTRDREPFKGMLEGPGGFLDEHETFIEATHRELKEELGITPDDYEPLQYLSEGYVEYPFGGEVVPVACIGFWSRLYPNVKLQPMDDVSAVNWYDLHELDLARLSAPDIHNGILALRKLFPQERGNDV